MLKSASTARSTRPVAGIRGPNQYEADVAAAGLVEADWSISSRPRRSFRGDRGRRYPESVAPPATAEVATERAPGLGNFIDRLIKVRKLFTEALFDDLSNNETPGFDVQLLDWTRSRPARARSVTPWSKGGYPTRNRTRRQGIRIGQ